jgi:hypothetical protein
MFDPGVGNRKLRYAQFRGVGDLQTFTNTTGTCFLDTPIQFRSDPIKLPSESPLWLYFIEDAYSQSLRFLA